MSGRNALRLTIHVSLVAQIDLMRINLAFCSARGVRSHTAIAQTDSVTYDPVSHNPCIFEKSARLYNISSSFLILNKCFSNVVKDYIPLRRL